jgi:glucosamine--fructose-6-phosphate aminotransferase (isomerizing)
MGLRKEIFEQPQVFERLLDTQMAEIERAAEAVRRRQVEFIYLAARGTSDHAGIYAQYLWGAQNRLPVALAAPSLQSMYQASPRLSNALVVGISQSGQSPDVVGVVAEGRRQGSDPGDHQLASFRHGPDCRVLPDIQAGREAGGDQDLCSRS